jgi:type II secretory pathway component PulK
MWRELVRPRGPVRHRFYRGGRRSKAGIALLLAVASILLLTVLVSEVAHGAVVRAQLAAQHRDDTKAMALAYSGVYFYRLVLILSNQIGETPMIQEFAGAFGINANELWQALPFLDTRLMRLVFVSDGQVDEEDVAEVKEAGGLSEEQVALSRESSSLLQRNFLDFDGDFHAEVQDEERRIPVNSLVATSFPELLVNPAAQSLMGMFLDETTRDWLYENDIVKEELVGNLADWIDPDDTRLFQGGSEDSVYARLDAPYRSKNAPFDTRDEIRLVDGWENDGVWERVGRHVTIYGDGKINVNTATKPIITGLLWAFAENPSETAIEAAVDQYVFLRGTPMAEGGMTIRSPQQFVDTIENMRGNGATGVALRDDILGAIKTSSKVFRVTSSGEVGNARVEIHCVFDFTTDQFGRVVFMKLR